MNAQTTPAIGLADTLSSDDLAAALARRAANPLLGDYIARKICDQFAAAFPTPDAAHDFLSRTAAASKPATNPNPDRAQIAALGGAYPPNCPWSEHG